MWWPHHFLFFNTPSHRSPWESVIQRAGHCVCDQSGQVLSSLRSKSVLNADKENKPATEIGYILCTIPGVFRETELVCRRFFFFFDWMKHCFDSHGANTACSAVQRIHRNPKSVYPTALSYWNQTQNDAQTSSSSFYGNRPVTIDCSAVAHSCGRGVSDQP